MSTSKNKPLPETKINRLSIIGKTAIKVGAKELSHQLTKPFKSTKNKQAKENQKKTH